jgi:hypothetical protein
MNETCMDNGYSGVIKWKEVYRGSPPPKGLELLIKYEDMELHLRARVSILVK